MKNLTISLVLSAAILLPAAAIASGTPVKRLLTERGTINAPDNNGLHYKHFNIYGAVLNKPLEVIALSDSTADIDCNLLTKNLNGEGYVVLATDQKHQSRCRMTIYPRTSTSLRVEIVNNGPAATNYQVIVSQ